jgi:hypothetical protein
LARADICNNLRLLDAVNPDTYYMYLKKHKYVSMYISLLANSGVLTRFSNQVQVRFYNFIGATIGCEPWNPPFIETGIGQLSSFKKRVESSSYLSVILFRG